MRKSYLIVASLFILVICYVSCKKEETSAKNQSAVSNNSQQVSIDIAKKYFEDNVAYHSSNPQKGNVGVNSSGSQNPNVLNNVYKSALWGWAKVLTIGKKSFVVVPIYFSQALYAKSLLFGTNASVDINKLYKLIVYTDTAGNLQSKVISVLSDSSSNFSPSSFTGILEETDWSGNFIRGYSIKSGKVSKLVPAPAPGSDSVVVNELDPIDLVCEVEDWYSYSGGTYTFLYTQILSCSGTSNGSPNGGGGDLLPINRTAKSRNSGDYS